MRFRDFKQNWHVISKLNRRPCVHPTSKLKKTTSQISLEKINIVSFFVNFLAQSDSRGWFFGTTVFYQSNKFYDFLIFSKIERLGRLKNRIQRISTYSFSSESWNVHFLISNARWTPGWTARCPFYFEIQPWTFPW